jgi:O-glycosyl hydrolase
MSVANEPDFAACGSTAPCYGSYPSMLYTAGELVNFMKVVGPKLRKASPQLKIIAPEPAEWLHLWSNDSAVGSQDPLRGMGYDYGHALVNDGAVWDLIDVIGTQQYDTQLAVSRPKDVSQAKPIWQTQMSGIEWWPEGKRSADISNGVAVAGWIHDALVNGQAAAWLWFRYQAWELDDNEGLALQDGTIAKRLYTLGNYSKFIRPGYTRVDVTGNDSMSVLLSAFMGADGTVVVVAINKGAAVTLPISISGGPAPASVTPWVTSATENLVARTPLAVSGASFSAALDGQTVTTFVGSSNDGQ